MERIIEDGRSVLLSSLTERIGTLKGNENDLSAKSVNLDALTVWGGPRKAETSLYNGTRVFSCVEDWNAFNPSLVEVIAVEEKCCNEEEFTKVDWSGFVNLRKLRIGNECFKYVTELKLDGMQSLERVEIGENCFTHYINQWPAVYWFARGFYLKNCPKVRELIIGSYSFSDYYKCEIDTDFCLEKIEIGVIDEKNSFCCSFLCGSLILRSE